MAPKLYIHCGVQKTGSTLLQETVRALAPTLKDDGLRVIPREALDASSFFDYHCRFRDRRPVDANLWMRLAEEWLESHLVRHRPKSVLISHEYLLGSAYRQFFFRAGEAARHLFEGFSGLGWEVTLIIYTKRQDRLIESMFRQRFRRTDPPSLKAFLSSLPWQAMDWLKLIRSLCRAMPRSRIVIRPAEIIRRGEPVFIRDFLSTCGIQYKGEIPIPEETNATLSKEAIVTRYPELLLERKALFPQEVVARSGGPLDALPDTLVPKAFLGRVLAYHHESNRKLGRTLLAKFPEADYAPDRL
ncbi:MAG: hypothetical protein ACFE0O_15540 [Opitutales bacterium]